MNASLRERTLRCCTVLGPARQFQGKCGDGELGQTLDSLPSGNWHSLLGVPVDQSSASESLSHWRLPVPTVPGAGTGAGGARPKSWKTIGSAAVAA